MSVGELRNGLDKDRLKNRLRSQGQCFLKQEVSHLVTNTCSEEVTNHSILSG